MDHIAESLTSDQCFDDGSIRDSFYPSKIIYYCDADDVIRDYESDHACAAEDICSGLKFDACDWLQAKMAYANALKYCADMAELEEALTECEEELENFNELCEGLGCEDIKPEFSNSCPHGWQAHNRETEDGTMIWSDEAGYYNAELLEGELMAASKKLSCGVYVTATWSKV